MNLTIIAKKWFDGANGNTYHSVRIYKKNIEIAVEKIAYGYGEGYLQTAHQLLRDIKKVRLGYSEWLRSKTFKKNLVLVDDVKRKRDL